MKSIPQNRLGKYPHIRALGGIQNSNEHKVCDDRLGVLCLSVLSVAGIVESDELVLIQPALHVSANSC